MKKKIMVVEDEPIIVQLFRINFELRGYQVVGIEGSENVLEKVIEEEPDLIILDLLMPKRNGWDVLEELKANPKTASVPVIICSVIAKPEDIRRGEEMGASAYVTKPFELREMVSVVERILGTGEENEGEE